VILVLSSREDHHATAVMKRLRARGAEAVRLDLARIPSRAGVELRFDPEPRIVVRDRRRAIDLARCTAAWWRRAGEVALPPAVRDPEHRRFGEQQWRAALSGAWSAVPIFWVNDPVREAVALRKVFQLAVAREVGLAIPRTLVTNDPRRSRAFVRSCGRGERGWNAITKVVQPGPEAARETRRISDADYAALIALRHILFFIQEYVDGVDLRVTIVGREIFAAELDARKTSFPDDGRMDWSHGGSLLRRARLPAPVRRGLLALMDRLGLEFGAIDLRRTDAGEHVFLEVNPAGQWLFVEAATGLPITDAVAELLARGGSRRRRP
jgi:hypothetical protein